MPEEEHMRNHELLKRIWELVNVEKARPQTKLIAIKNLLRRKRPEICKRMEDANDKKD
jgi:hypothetical protein